MHSLGINIGSSNVKVTMLEGNNIVWSAVEPHEGNFLDTLKKILSSRNATSGHQNAGHRHRRPASFKYQQRH